jgi:hypothetical protein
MGAGITPAAAKEESTVFGAHQGSTGRKRRAIAALVVLTAAGALAGQALASGAYRVHLSVPGTVNKGHTFTVTAAGAASNASRLTVFLATHKCKKSAKAEATVGTKIISHRVVHTYSKSATKTASVPGKHYACAYLSSVPPAKLTYARASKAYTVVAPSSPTVSLVVTPTTVPCTAVYFTVKAADPQGLADVHVNLGDGVVFDEPQDGADSYQQLYQQGYPSGFSSTATVTATSVHGQVASVSKPFTAPPCP